MDGDARARQRWTLRLACISTALLMINVAAPQVALPDLARDLGASFSDIQWVFSGYAFAPAVLLLTAGSLADRYGRKRIFIVGLGIFVVASLLCALAPAPWWLVVARILKGVGAALVFPSSLALLASEFHGRERRTAIAIWGSAISASFVLGPLIGGALVELVDWRAVFAFNLVLGLPCLELARRYIRESRDPDPRPTDLPGVATLTVGLFLVTFALLRGNALGWGSATVVACFVLGGLALAAFVAVEARVRIPMLDLRLFANHTFTGATIAVAVLGGATFGAFVFLSLFLMEAQGRGPVEAGLVLAPQAAVSFCTALVAGKLNERLELRWALVGGLVTLALGMLALRGYGVDDSWESLLPGLVLIGVGTGLVNPLGTFAHLGVLPPSHGGLAAAMNNTARQLGLCVGVAALGAIVDAALLDSGGAPGSAAYAGAFSVALDDLWTIGIAANLLAAAAAALLVRREDMWSPAVSARHAEA